MLLKLSLKLCLKKNPGEKQNGQLGELVLRSCDAFGECLKPQDPLIMIWLPIILLLHNNFAPTSALHFAFSIDVVFYVSTPRQSSLL